MDNIKFGNNTHKTNKVLDTLNINKKIFKSIFPIKWDNEVKNFCFHLDSKQKIINQFTDNDVIDYLKNLLPKWNILYIDYFEIRSCKRDEWIWTKVVQKIIDKSRNIWLSWIYLDSCEESMEFWKKNWFIVDNDIQENLNWNTSNYHCSYIILK
jgi:hypothetical protein